MTCFRAEHGAQDTDGRVEVRGLELPGEPQRVAAALGFQSIKLLLCLAALGAGLRRFHSLLNIPKRLPAVFADHSFGHGHNTEVVASLLRRPISCSKRMSDSN